jgi:tRNA(Leu) C34 or U34 (ribose-2'-O)-methylase TrmL
MDNIRKKLLGTAESELCGPEPEALLERCERTVKIPMDPGCESLNAAMAATVALWERFR